MAVLPAGHRVKRGPLYVQKQKTKNENQSCWQGPLERRRIFLRSENRPRKTRGYATISRSDAKGHVFKKRTPTAMSSAFSPWRTPCSSEAYPLRMFWRRQSTASTKKRQPHDALASCGCLPSAKLLYRGSPWEVPLLFCAQQKPWEPFSWSRCSQSSRCLVS